MIEESEHGHINIIQKNCMTAVQAVNDSEITTTPNECGGMKWKKKFIHQVEIDLNVKCHFVCSGKHHMPNREVNNTSKKIDCLYFTL